MAKKSNFRRVLIIWELHTCWHLTSPCPTGRNLNKSFATLEQRFYEVLRNTLPPLCILGNIPKHNRWILSKCSGKHFRDQSESFYILIRVDTWFYLLRLSDSVVGGDWSADERSGGNWLRSTLVRVDLCVIRFIKISRALRVGAKQTNPNKIPSRIVFKSLSLFFYIPTNYRQKTP